MGVIVAAIMIVLGLAALRFATPSERFLHASYDARLKKGLGPTDFDAFRHTHRFMFTVSGILMLMVGGILLYWLL
jgi:hypothetical protein